MDMLSGNWPTGEGSGFTVQGELSTAGVAPEPQGKDRRAERVPIEMGAALRQRGAAGVSVQILDLSTDGFRVATHLDLFVGTDVWLRLGGLEACHAKVVWASGHYVGCAFSRPLHPAVLEMIVQRSKSR
jgi:hypothetical protein